MQLKKSIILTILSLIIISIQSFGQKDSVICLTNNQVKFFLKQNIIVKGLQVDTALYNQMIQNYIKAVYNMQNQRDGLNIALKAQSDITDNYRTSLGTLQKKYDRAQKWLKVFRKVIVAVVAIVVAETIIIYVILTN